MGLAGVSLGRELRALAILRSKHILRSKYAFSQARCIACRGSTDKLLLLMMYAHKKKQQLSLLVLLPLLLPLALALLLYFEVHNRCALSPPRCPSNRFLSPQPPSP